jgi:hypothetical protein
LARIDFFSGLGLAVLGVIVFFLTADLPKVTRGIGPGDYPRVAAMGLILFGLIMSGLNAFKLGRKGEKTASKFPKGALIRVAILVGWSMLYIIVMPYTGFVLSTPVYLFGGMLYFGLKKYRLGVITSLAVTLVIFFLFRYSFQIMLPIAGIFDMF